LEEALTRSKNIYVIDNCQSNAAAQTWVVGGSISMSINLLISIELTVVDL